jgi:hypothetical protein
MAHIVQNAPLISTWDPPEGSSTKYPVLSMAHLLYAPRIFDHLVAHIIQNAPLITLWNPPGPYWPDPCESYAWTHNQWDPPLWKGGRLISGAFFIICATDKVAQIYKLAAPPPPFHSSPSNTKLDLGRPPPHHLNFSILASILGC